jgi:hypothetical protein
MRANRQCVDVATDRWDIWAFVQIRRLEKYAAKLDKQQYEGTFHIGR